MLWLQWKFADLMYLWTPLGANCKNSGMKGRLVMNALTGQNHFTEKTTDMEPVYIKIGIIILVLALLLVPDIVEWIKNLLR